MVTQFSTTDTESNLHSSETLFPNPNYCFCLPYRWRKVPSSEHEEYENEIRPNGTGTLWSRGLSAFQKLREWSEIVAGPRWKTFIRRFKHTNNKQQSSKFQYDPSSYALNFDQGPLQNADPETENEYLFRNFSSRYVLQPPSTAVIPITGKGEIGQSFV